MHAHCVYMSVKCINYINNYQSFGASNPKLIGMSRVALHFYILLCEILFSDVSSTRHRICYVWPLGLPLICVSVRQTAMMGVVPPSFILYIYILLQCEICNLNNNNYNMAYIVKSQIKNQTYFSHLPGPPM